MTSCNSKGAFTAGHTIAVVVKDSDIVVKRATREGCFMEK